MPARLRMLKTGAFGGQTTRTFPCGSRTGRMTWLSWGSHVATPSRVRCASPKSSWETSSTLMRHACCWTGAQWTVADNLRLSYTIPGLLRLGRRQQSVRSPPPWSLAATLLVIPSLLTFNIKWKQSQWSRWNCNMMWQSISLSGRWILNILSIRSFCFPKIHYQFLTYIIM